MAGLWFEIYQRPVRELGSAKAREYKPAVIVKIPTLAGKYRGQNPRKPLPSLRIGVAAVLISAHEQFQPSCGGDLIGGPGEDRIKAVSLVRCSSVFAKE
jgi:hypothetical protein